MCEARFLALAVIKSSYGTEINVKRELRLAVSSLPSRLEIMCNNQPAFTLFDK